MAEEQDPLVGITIRNYVLVRMLGRGAMGMVYLGRRPDDSHEVAIKFLAGEFGAKQEFVARFMNEAASCAALDHENIVRVFEAGQEDGAHFMVMEFVDGVDLAHFLQVQDKVKESQALPWLQQAGRGLGYAHSQGIVHRDLKPENIMLTHEGKVKVADLGLSKNLEGGDGNLSMTMSGTVIGTPYYISPEQARDAKRVDPRTDIYSLGATFYHLVTGYPPFQGNSAAEVMAKHMNEQLIYPQRRNVALSDGFSDVLMKMMEKDPAKRFQNMEEMQEALERLGRGEAAIPKKVKLRQSQMDRFQERRSSWNPKLAWGMAAVALLLAALSAAWFLKRSGPAPAPSESPTTTEIAAAPPQTSPEIPPSDTPPPPSTSEGTVPPSLAAPSETPPAETIQPIPPKPPSPAPSSLQTKEAGGEDEEETLQLTGHGKSSRRRFPGSANWVDGIALLVLFLGIPLATKVGWFWASLRALAFWVAVVVSCRWFGELARWFQTALVVPVPVSIPLAFFTLSAAVMFSAWVATNRLIGHEKETWQLKLNRAIAILPGIVLGMAFAVWFAAALVVMDPETFPVRESWIGSRMIANFPSIDEFSRPSK